MRKHILVDCDTGLIYGPYESCAKAEAYAETYALAAWEVVGSDNKLIAWSRKPDVQAELNKCQSAA